MAKTDVTVKIIGKDSRWAAFTLGVVEMALQMAGHHDLAEEFVDEAAGGNYNHLLAVVRNYVNVSETIMPCGHRAQY